MKKIIIFMLCLCMMVSLFACTDAPEVSEQSEEVSKEEGYGPREITVNGVSLKEFTIVYCNSATFDNYNHYRLLVDEINAFLQEYCGYTLEAVPDTTAETEYEILVGFTAGRSLRNAFDRDSFEAGQYSLVVKGTKVMLAGSYANGWHFALEKFIRVCKTDEDADLTDFMTSGNEPVIKVACVGDSITQGINSDRNDMTYPAYIQQMLGWDYCVLNAGLSGYSICKNDPYAYASCKQYGDALKFEPDVVIFALGTNDSNPGQDWKDWSDPERKDIFLESARELLDSFYDKNENVQIFICTPTPLFKVGDDKWNAAGWNANIDAYSLPLIKQIAKEYSLPEIDLYTWGKDKEAIFTDGLHPKNVTYKTYAKAIYDRLEDTIKKVEK
ncbi:MAG: hypothetical protein E7674_05925 [Ruminococcaceae bacterium]|nr:hypothetical protein [Oscillospiraceae bacterium]